MTKSELIAKVYQKLSHLPKQQVKSSVEHLFDQVSGALSQNQRVEIRGFGAFSLRYWGPRFARNPSTGKTWRTVPRYSVYFKTGKEMRERVDTGGKEQAEAVA